jgi:cytochrome c5
MSDREFWKFFAGLIGALVALTIMLFILANAIGSKAKKIETTAVDSKAVAERIKPVGEVTVASGSAVLNAIIPAANAADGKSVYDKSCMVCHATGVANAPKFGDKAAWAPRIKQGMDALYANSIKGKGAMPPKGTYAGPDADVKAAVDYMVNASK